MFSTTNYYSGIGTIEQNFVKFPPTLISFGRKMAKWLKLYAV